MDLMYLLKQLLLCEKIGRSFLFLCMISVLNFIPIITLFSFGAGVDRVLEVYQTEIWLLCHIEVHENQLSEENMPFLVLKVCAS